MSLKEDCNYRIKVSNNDNVLSVNDLLSFLNKIDDGRQVVFLYNKNDDLYYKIDNCRVDSEYDIVLDISGSSFIDLCGVNDVDD